MPATVSQVGAERNRADISHAHGHTTVVSCEHDLADIGHGLRVAATAHHVFGAGHLDEASPHVVVTRPHRLNDLGDRHVEGAQAIGIHLHLVLPHKAAQRRDLGDARHRLQVVLEIPVLVGTQLRQTGTAGRVDERVLKDPAHAGRIGTELGANALRQSWEDP